MNPFSNGAKVSETMVSPLSLGLPSLEKEGNEDTRSLISSKKNADSAFILKLFGRHLLSGCFYPHEGMSCSATNMVCNNWSSEPIPTSEMNIPKDFHFLPIFANPFD